MGVELTIGESFLLSAFSMIMVLAVLFIIAEVVELACRIINRVPPPVVKATAPDGHRSTLPASPAKAGEAYGEELIALLTAAVCAYTGEKQPTVRVLGSRREGMESSWAYHSRLENINEY